jgi:ribose transport system ATP-binding protein
MSQSVPVLRLDAVSKRFQGSVALTRVSLAVHGGEVLGLLGQNGAGKSTVVKIISGAVSPSAGTLFVDGKPMIFSRPSAAHAAGIYTIFQEFSLVPRLSVAENIYVNDLPQRFGLVPWRKLRLMAREVLSSIGFGSIDVDAAVEDLSTAERQIVEIAKAVHHNAKMIVLDEPTATLPRPDVEKLFRLLRQLRSRGVALIYITHHLEEVDEICDRVTILRNGQNVTTQPATALDEAQIVALMLGGEAGLADPADAAKPALSRAGGAHAKPRGLPALEIRHLSDATILRDVSLTVMPGESVAVTGLTGSGQLQLAACAFGARRRSAGEVWAYGRRIVANSPRASALAGVGWVPEERKSQGLVLNMSVRGNLTLSSLNDVSRVSVINDKREKRTARNLAKLLSVRAPSLEHPISSLSGGNQQKIVFGRWLLAKSRVMILSDPTRGVDVGARADIYREIDAFLEGGGAALVVTSDIDEAMLFDRILVIARGRVVGEFSRDNVNYPQLLSLLR